MTENKVIERNLLNWVIYQLNLWKGLSAMYAVTGGKPAQDFAMDYMKKYFNEVTPTDVAIREEATLLLESPKECLEEYKAARKAYLIPVNTETIEDSFIDGQPVVDGDYVDLTGKIKYYTENEH